MASWIVFVRCLWFSNLPNYPEHQIWLLNEKDIQLFGVFSGVGIYCIYMLKQNFNNKYINLAIVIYKRTCIYRTSSNFFKKTAALIFNFCLVFQFFETVYWHLFFKSYPLNTFLRFFFKNVLGFCSLRLMS